MHAASPAHGAHDSYILEFRMPYRMRGRDADRKHVKHVNVPEPARSTFLAIRECSVRVMIDWLWNSLFTVDS